MFLTSPSTSYIYLFIYFSSQRLEVLVHFSIPHLVVLRQEQLFEYWAVQKVDPSIHFLCSGLMSPIAHFFHGGRGQIEPPETAAAS